MLLIDEEGSKLTRTKKNTRREDVEWSEKGRTLSKNDPDHGLGRVPQAAHSLTARGALRRPDQSTPGPSDYKTGLCAAA